MFWKYNNNSSSEIETLLAKQDVTLQEVMEAEDVITQCKVQNKTLIEFLCKPEIMEELVGLIARDPSPDLDENVRFKYPNIACELLTSDIPHINERLAGDEVLLDKLYGFLESEAPLNPLLASYFSRILGVLITKKTEQVLVFLKAKDTFISLLLKHLGTSAIMDLLLKLMTQVESTEMRQNILNWLDSQRIIQSLVGLLHSKIDEERHFNVSQLLVDFLRIARDTVKNSERSDPDPLLNTMESPETVALLLNNIFDSDDGARKSESAIVGGVQVLLALLDVNNNNSIYGNNNSIVSYSRLVGFGQAHHHVTAGAAATAAAGSTNPISTSSSSSGFNKNGNGSSNNSNNSDDVIDAEHLEAVLNSTAEAIQPRLKDFHDLLSDPPKKLGITTTVGVLDPPLGNTRLQVTRLLAALISCNNPNVHREIISLGTFAQLLQLFFAYPWNNFFHTQVERCLVYALKLSPPPPPPTKTTTANVSSTSSGDNIIVAVAEATEDRGDDDEINALSRHLLIDCNVIDRILKAWKNNDDQQKDSLNLRQGYMGHLICIMNQVVELCCSDGESNKGPSLSRVLNATLPDVAKSLDEFKDTTLKEINTVEESLLGGVYPNSSNEENDAYDDISFPQDQMYSNYQIQHMGAHGMDGYSGMIDDAFNENDDTIQGLDEPPELNFGLVESDLVKQQEMFQQLCAQTTNSLGDDQMFDETSNDALLGKDTGRNNTIYYNSSDSDSDETPGSVPMDVDASPTDEAARKTDPWAPNKKTNNFNIGDWADFSSAFDATLTPTPGQFDSVVFDSTSSDDAISTPAADKMDVNDSSGTTSKAAAKEQVQEEKSEVKEQQQGGEDKTSEATCPNNPI